MNDKAQKDILPILQKILDDCKKGNKKAQKKLFDLYSKKGIVVCYRYARKLEDAEDMMMEGFAKVFQNMTKFNEIKEFSKWFNTVLINTAINYYKKESKHYYNFNIEDVKETDFEDLESDEKEPQFSTNDLMKALNFLPDGQREIFNLYAIDGYSHKEIAEIIEIKESTVRTQYMRAKIKLKEILLKKISR